MQRGCITNLIAKYGTLYCVVFGDNKIPVKAKHARAYVKPS